MPLPRPARNTSTRSSLHRLLEPLEDSLPVLFAVWTVIVAAVWLNGWDAARYGDDTVAHGDLKAAFALLLQVLDSIWVLLAAANIYLSLTVTEGLSASRRWTGAVLLTSMGIGILSLLTQFPLGPITFPSRLGVQLFGVPFGIPLLWLIIIAGGREIIARLLPRASHVQVALLTGLLAAGSAWMMEPIAREERAWWLWREGRTVLSAPIQNFLTWGVAATALAWRFPSRIAPHPHAARWKIPATWAALHVVFLTRHLARLLS